jgi:hypothetical protein
VIRVGETIDWSKSSNGVLRVQRERVAPEGRWYRCPMCQDRGVISYIKEIEMGGRVIPHSVVARCNPDRCEAARSAAQSLPTYASIFGEWPGGERQSAKIYPFPGTPAPESETQSPPPPPAEPGVFAPGWEPKGETGTGSAVAEFTDED